MREFEIERYSILFVLGILFIFGCYHFGLYLNRIEDKASLFFSFFCFNLFLRQLGTGEINSWLFEAPNWFIFDIFLRYEYFSIFFAPYFFAGFLNHLFDKKLERFQKITFIFSHTPWGNS